MSLRLGAFARIWPGTRPEDAARAMARHGLRHAQWNFSAIGRPTVSGEYRAADFTSVRAAFDAAGVSIWGLSATYNIIDPDVARRESLTRAAEHMIASAPLLGVRAVTICTGSNDPANMWRWHPGNSSAASWAAALEVIGRLAAAAAAARVVIGIEPETANVISDAWAARRLLDTLGTDAMGIVLDPANLLSPQTLTEQRRVVGEAFDLLGDHVIALHAKDVTAPGEYAAPGSGGLDYRLVAALHRQHAAAAPVIIQDTAPDDIAAVTGFLRRAWAAPARLSGAPDA